jgi:type IV secretion system protein VirD4
VRVSFATNNERTARRVSDALGTTTELRAMKNYAGHRLSPWLGHLMVSRQETARALLTPGEIMQLPPDDELIMVSGRPPIRAEKARYYEDRRFRQRVLPPAELSEAKRNLPASEDHWHGFGAPATVAGETSVDQNQTDANDAVNGGVRREPELPQHEEVGPDRDQPKSEFDFSHEETDKDVERAEELLKQAANRARQAAMDPDDDLNL